MRLKDEYLGPWRLDHWELYTYIDYNDRALVQIAGSAREWTSVASQYVGQQIKHRVAGRLATALWELS